MEKAVPLHHKGRNRAEYSAGGRFVFVGMHHRGLVEQDGGLTHIAPPNKKTGTIIYGGNAGEGFEGTKNIGRSPRRCNHI